MPGPEEFYPRAPGQRSMVHGSVSTLQPAPGHFTDPLFVVLDYDPENALQITSWPALHGGTMPTLGADVLIGFDEYKTPRVLWWQGTYTTP